MSDSSLTSILTPSTETDRVRLNAADIMARLRQATSGEMDHESLELCLAEWLKEFETQRVVAEKQVLESEKWASIGRLAAGVAHEINTPVQYVGDNLRSLSDVFCDLATIIQKYQSAMRLANWGQLTSEALADIEAAEAELDISYLLADAPSAVNDGLAGVERISEIVRAMKDFSHVDRGEVSAVNINRLLQNTLTVARNEYKYVANVETHFGTLPMIEGYAGELSQVFLNLLVNAAHAIADTGQFGTITITTRHDESSVEIAIDDTGTGIPEQIRDRVFDSFVTTKEVGKGTGQGLSIARRIVNDKHKGTLAFETELGKGTRFIVRLPIARASADSPGDEQGEA